MSYDAAPFIQEIAESDVFGAAKQVAEQRAEAVDLTGAFLETVCPSCDRTVGALVIDGPDPVFVDVQCPLAGCGHEWTEAIT
ncbi:MULTISPECIES: hypothetical protein [Microbacterium]|uniref:hypothetical protein n=1 Tax=Microbacterium TaxID=33882 RepID=UPI001C2BF08F|nr:hypothetical protein [Microbacterium paraoxydans]QXE28912.1 hypothetical protein IZR02_10975 [Microbacterium paraoxydans]